MKTTDNITYETPFRVVWCTRQKRILLTDPEVVSSLRVCLHQIAEENEVEIRKLNIHPYFVDMVLECDPRKSQHSVIKILKHRSGSYLLEKFPELKKKTRCMWSMQYLISSTGGVTDEDIKQYIDSQESYAQYMKRYRKRVKEKQNEREGDSAD